MNCGCGLWIFLPSSSNSVNGSCGLLRPTSCQPWAKRGAVCTRQCPMSPAAPVIQTNGFEHVAGIISFREHAKDEIIVGRNLFLPSESERLWFRRPTPIFYALGNFFVLVLFCNFSGGFAILIRCCRICAFR